MDILEVANMTDEQLFEYRKGVFERIYAHLGLMSRETTYQIAVKAPEAPEADRYAEDDSDL
jgi:hypothetical protein